jgi:hypothetical protein
LNEHALEHVKVNLLNSSQKSPIELCSGLLAQYQEVAVKKEQKPLRSNTPLSKQEKSKVTIVSKPVVDLSISSTLADKTLPKIDTENITFQDLQAAYDLALAASMTEPPEPELKENKKDKKKGTTPDVDSKRKYSYLICRRVFDATGVFRLHQ